MSESKGTMYQEGKLARWRIPVPLIAIPNMVLLLLVIVGLYGYFQKQVRDMRLGDLEDKMTDEARLVGSTLQLSFDRGDPIQVFDQLARQYADLLNARITIVASDGLVIGESNEDRTKMDNHLNRPEVQQALATGVGKSIRFSNTLKYNLMYVAVPVVSGGKVVAFSRVALPMAKIEADLGRLQAGLRVVALLSALLSLLLTIFFSERTARPLRELAETTQHITAGDLTQNVLVKNRGEVGTLERSFGLMTIRLREMIEGLEMRVEERTRELQNRSKYLQASAEVSRVAISILDMDQLVQQVTELIRERFELYYVGLFLVDESREWAVLRAGTGQAGQAMLARGHKLAVDGNSMIGWSIVNAQARIARQADADTVYRITAELPETRSEVALPLRSRGKVLGALTVQSAQSDAFDHDTVTVLQTMADQIAIAMDNARLLAESQDAVETVRRVAGELSREGWSHLMRAQMMPAVRSVEGGVVEPENTWPAEALRALHTGQTNHATASDAPVSLAVPVRVRGNVIGVIDTFKPAGNQWTPEEIALAETLTEQLGIALESARLYQDTQRRAAREQLVGQVTARMRESLNVETVLKTTVDEIYQKLGLDGVLVRLVVDKDDLERIR